MHSAIEHDAFGDGSEIGWTEGYVELWRMYRQCVLKSTGSEAAADKLISEHRNKPHKIRAQRYREAHAKLREAPYGESPGNPWDGAGRAAKKLGPC